MFVHAGIIEKSQLFEAKNIRQILKELCKIFKFLAESYISNFILYIKAILFYLFFY